jgi:hypothetical protein
MENHMTLNPKESSIEKSQVTQEENQKIKRKVYCEFKQSESSYNPDATRFVDDIERGRDIILDQANIAQFSRDSQVEPTNFEQAWNHNDPNDQETWRMVIKKEFNGMYTEKVWGKQSTKKISQKE